VNQFAACAAFPDTEVLCTALQRLELVSNWKALHSTPAAATRAGTQHWCIPVGPIHPGSSATIDDLLLALLRVTLIDKSNQQHQVINMY
jgi:hypothetical protein